MIAIAAQDTGVLSAMPPIYSSPVFWAAFWAGLSGPAMLYEPIDPYYLYLGATNVAHSFGAVGMYLDQVSGAYLYVGQPTFRPTVPVDANAPV
jgi:hypothetical protein